MGRNYAGVLGPLAFLAVLIRGWRMSADVETTLLTAWLALLAFAAVGWMAGRLADWMTVEAVRTKVSAELAAQQASKPAAAGTQDNLSGGRSRAA